MSADLKFVPYETQKGAARTVLLNDVWSIIARAVRANEIVMKFLFWLQEIAVIYPVS